MKFTLGWLKEFLDTNAALADISTALTKLGLEVEGIDDPSARLKDFIVAEIVEAAPHPNATKLQVCKVNDGETVRQIVCGAANARAGLKTVLAREGVFIPGSGITIKKTKIRDVESNGMLCSAEELGLDTASDGILELPANAMPGTQAAPALGLGDPVIEIAITPNRADALGVYGVARDLAAAGLGTLKPLNVPATGTAAANTTVTLAAESCPYYIGCEIRGVKNGPSPDWLQQRLRAIGLRPISALVDITNYLTFTYGRPAHVYDLAKLSGNITVRSAHENETVSALNDKEYTLKGYMPAVADDKGAVAVAGIIGGTDTGVSDETRDVFLEIAYFDPVSIAKAGRALELATDARYRFERGVDPAFLETGALLAVGLIRELCGGEASALIVSGKSPYQQRQVPFHPARVDTLGGVSVNPDECKRILTALGFTVAAGEHWRVSPPSWRGDVEGEADIVEEILRVHGYDHIPATPLPKLPGIGLEPLPLAQQRVSSAKNTLVTRGFLECCTFSFLSQKLAEQFGGGDASLKLANPISVELETMRPSLLPNLLLAAQANANRGVADTQLCEVGLQFKDVSTQQNIAAGIRSGVTREHAYPDARFSVSARTPDAFDAKADALAVLAALGVNTDGLAITSDTPPWYHPGRSGALTLGGKIVLAWFGELHPATVQQFDLTGRAAAFEIFLDAIPASRAKGKAKASLQTSAFQSVERDFAFVVADAVRAADLLKAVYAAEKQLIKQAEVFDVYSGKGVDEGRKSVAVKAVLQASDRTLTDAEIDQVMKAIVESAEKSCGASLRS